ncbi:SusC/RagA family TonB-linked outer membrane protein [Flavobacterium rakeshii]|uniref:SusC/RagA family TonB-linked outer membrane protein n=1 Tax=Flavobacterium rakeshii TaxID=1038845 RepID=A0A6N8HFY5_9FLAO|nr:SusC/RagA family TonB-linked outer membrane protein [Flavobacterium rakeshii]MUV04608.1 SusC/RagA family TonB-linked outer membrane protein [Flavobacterium rakeshii]
MKIFSANNGLRLLFYSFVLASCPPAASARAHASPPYSVGYYQQTISGTVSDTSGPLPGVSVLVKNSGISTISDVNGNFQLRAAIGDTLVFSFIGYKEVTRVATSPVMAVVLQEDAAQLQELVINAGYYSVKDKERTGSIARITAADIEKQPVSNVLATMQGRMAGVNITQKTGVPGGGFDILIRGQNSLRGEGNSPMYIIDGVPYSSQSVGNSLTSNIIPGDANPLSNLNPQEIESIEVLKDADATAIYGSRGANGVVLITTKKGKAGKVTYSGSLSSGFGSVTRFMDLMNTPQYLEMRTEAFANDGITQYPANAYDINGTWDQSRNTDWQKELLGGTAGITQVSLSASGGSEQTRFLLSANYRTESTVYPGDFEYRRKGMRFAVNHNSPDNRFSLSFTGGYSLQDNNQPGTDLTFDALRLAPNAPALYNPDGSLNWENSTWDNPLRMLEGKYTSNSGDLTTNAVLTWKIWKGLAFRSNLGFTDLNYSESTTSPSTIYNPAYGAGPEYSSIYVSNTARRSWIAEPQLSWEGQLRDLQLKALVGTTFQELTNTQLVQSGTGFTSNALIYNLSAATTKNILNNDRTVYRYQAGFARVNLNWKGKYIMNLTGRRDGSSRFGPSRRFANFGAVGMAWLFSREKLFTESTILSFGKLRGSYGTSGNDQIGDYQYLNTYTSTGINYNGTIGLQPSRLFNPDFGWETNKKLEVALETGFLKDRVFLTASWYRNRSSNQLVGIPLPGTTGFTSIQANLGATVQNQGTELTLRTINIDNGAFSWITAANISFAKNKLIAFPGLESSTYSQQYAIGKPLNIVMLYEYTGLDPETGTYQFRDVDGDGVISSPNDKKYIADFNPQYYGGIQNTFSYKGITLDFLFQFVKQDNWNPNYMLGMPGAMVNQPVAALDRWQQPGDISSFQQYSSGTRADVLNAFSRYTQSSAAVSDASYIRLKNLSVSYALPQAWTQQWKCRLFVEAQNLLTITSYDGADPEFTATGYLPPLKMITTGIQLTF